MSVDYKSLLERLIYSLSMAEHFGDDTEALARAIKLAGIDIDSYAWADREELTELLLAKGINLSLWND